MNMSKAAYCLSLLAMASLLASCASEPPKAADAGPGQMPVLPAGDAAQNDTSDVSRSADIPASTSEEEKHQKIRKGSGVFVQGVGTGKGNGYADGDGVTLNFENASLPEFLRVVFESILKENYLIDPSVSGSVTLHTTRPVTADTVLPIVEAVLEQNGAALIRDEGMFKVLPLGDAASELVNRLDGFRLEDRPRRFGGGHSVLHVAGGLFHRERAQ